jgi:nucleotide-binding universal stress UspA family protein
MNTILLATDGSPPAMEATTLALELAQPAGWELRIVTVWSPVVTSYGFAPMVYVPEMSDAEREQAGWVLAEAVKKAQAAGLEPTSELRRGRAVEEICNAAEECHATLVVLGAHGWGAMKRFVFGSVSTGVLHHAPCPVLVVRGESHVSQPELVGAGAARDGR